MPNGEVDILGRIDRQVKIHGHRIELAEIEAALSNDPSVESCAVVVTGTGDSPALAATVVLTAPLLAEDFSAMLGLVIGGFVIGAAAERTGLLPRTNY